MPDPIRVLLADDHTMLREGLRRSLTAEGFSIVGEASDGDEAVSLARQLDPDVVLMDVTMPVTDGIEATRTIRETLERVQVVMLTMHADAELIRGAIAAGAAGYLTKDCTTEEVARTIRQAASGDTMMSAELASSMLAEATKLDAEGPATDPEPASGSRSEGEGVISKREEEVLQLIAQGQSTAEVAEQLFISAKTVKNHLANIYEKLDSRDRTQAVVRAVRMGIIRIE